MFGLAGTLVLGEIQKHLAASGEDPSIYGTTLAASVIASYLLSLPLWFKAGNEYKKQMDKTDGN